MSFAVAALDLKYQIGGTKPHLTLVGGYVIDLVEVLTLYTNYRCLVFVSMLSKWLHLQLLTLNKHANPVFGNGLGFRSNFR